MATKYTYEIAFKDVDKKNISINSNHLPVYKELQNEIYLIIYGEHKTYTFYGTEVSIQCIWRLI